MDAPVTFALGYGGCLLCPCLSDCISPYTQTRTIQGLENQTHYRWHWAFGIRPPLPELCSRATETYQASLARLIFHKNKESKNKTIKIQNSKINHFMQKTEWKPSMRHRRPARSISSSSARSSSSNRRICSCVIPSSTRCATVVGIPCGVADLASCCREMSCWSCCGWSYGS
jgi:hypothetical protein